VGRLLRQVGNVLFLLTEYQEALVYYKLAENIYNVLYEVDSIEMISIKDDIAMLLQFNAVTTNDRCINNNNNNYNNKNDIIITHIIDDNNHMNVSNGINNTKEFSNNYNTDHDNDDNNYSKNDNDVDQHSKSSSTTSDISSTNISYSQYNRIVMNEDSVEYYDNPLIMIEANMSCQENEMIIHNDSMELHYSSQYRDVDDNNSIMHENSYYYGHGIDSNSDNSTSCNVVVGDDDDDDDECHHHQQNYSHRQKNSIYPNYYVNPMITLPPPTAAAAIDDTKINEYDHDSLLSTTAVTIITNTINAVDANDHDHGDCHTVVKDRDSPSSVAFSENML
jgi:hypothetical protein